MDISDFSRSGIVINPRSLAALGLAFTGGLGGPERATNVAATFSQFLRGLGETGDIGSSRLGVIAAQEFGDLPDQPGASDLLQARLRLSTQPFTPRDARRRLNRFLGRAIEGAGGGDAGELTVLAELQALGVRNLSVADIVGLNRFRTGEAPPEGFEQFFTQRNLREAGRVGAGRRAAREAGSGLDALTQRAGAALDPAVGRGAEQGNRRGIAASTTLLATVQNLSEVTVNTIESTQSLGAELEKLTNVVREASNQIHGAIQDFAGGELQ